MGTKRVRIPDFDVKLDESEIAVTQTRVFQRLSYIRQLGLAYLVYPGASHSRGAHSLQTLFEATKILEALEVEPDSEDAQNVRMAALLHDIGHIPFSHTLEDEHPILQRHDKVRYRKALDRLVLELPPAAIARVTAARPILNALAGEGPLDWRGDLIGNTLCADLLAYISADAKWTGIEKRPGVYRVYDYFRLEDDSDGVKRLCTRLTKGGLRTDIVSAIMDLLDMRYALTERVVYHHAKCVASAMLARAARLRHLGESDSLLDLGDESFLRLLGSEEGSLGGDSTEREAAARIVSHLLSRRLYKRIFKVSGSQCDEWDRAHEIGTAASKFCARWRDPEQVETALRKVELKHNLPLGSLALWCPDRDAGMKLVETLVTWETSDGNHHPVMLRSPEVRTTFPGVSRRVEGIEQQYKDLWAFWIAIDREYVDQSFVIQKSLESEFSIPCDPIFADTYLGRDSDLAPARVRSGQIQNAFEAIRPRVDIALAEQAAREGLTALKDKGVDPGSVLKAIEVTARESSDKAEEPAEKKKQRKL
jgi:uncharacterized protein